MSILASTRMNLQYMTHNSLVALLTVNNINILSNNDTIQCHPKIQYSNTDTQTQLESTRSNSHNSMHNLHCLLEQDMEML